MDQALRSARRESAAADQLETHGHDASRSLSIDEIHPRAQLIQGRETPADYYLAEKLYDGIMFVGQHARETKPVSRAEGSPDIGAGMLADLVLLDASPLAQTSGLTVID